MSSDRPSNITIQFARRSAAKRGFVKSDDYNDNFSEVSGDLGTITSQWNNRLVPLVATLPNGTVDSNVDAFGDGLDGRTMYVHSDATSAASTVRYYNTGKTRPRTVQEQFVHVYQQIDSNLATLQNSLTAVARNASEISITDAGNLLTATNVEEALQEIMTAVQGLISG